MIADELMTTLRVLRSDDVSHFDRSLTEHLINTYGLLSDWKAADALCRAGLYHAAYGTDGFETTLVTLDNRAALADVIGADVEALVYLYAACDRRYTYEHAACRADRLDYRDRFNGRARLLDAAEARALCELTFANELEIAIRNPAFRARYRDEFLALFPRLRPLVSAAAFLCFSQVFE